MLSEVSVHNEVSRRLGDEGLSRVCSNLWAVDCQTCGRPLGGTAPALCVDDLSDTAAIATLHHQACRPSSWGSEPSVGQETQMTYLTHCILLPDEYFGGTSDAAERLGCARPTFVLNTWAEGLVIERDGADRWQIVTYTYRHLGMRPLGAEHVIGRAITAGFATLQPGAVMAHLADHAWSAPAELWVAECIERYQGVTLCITSALGPGTLNTEYDLLVLLANGGIELGWLALR